MILVNGAKGETCLCMATIKYSFHKMVTDFMPERRPSKILIASCSVMTSAPLSLCVPCGTYVRAYSGVVVEVSAVSQIASPKAGKVDRVWFTAVRLKNWQILCPAGSPFDAFQKVSLLNVIKGADGDVLK